MAFQYYSRLTKIDRNTPSKYPQNKSPRAIESNIETEKIPELMLRVTSPVI